MSSCTFGTIRPVCCYEEQEDWGYFRQTFILEGDWIYFSQGSKHVMFLILFWHAVGSWVLQPYNKIDRTTIQNAFIATLFLFSTSATAVRKHCPDGREGSYHVP
jgi:hypothetical protein